MSMFFDALQSSTGAIGVWPHGGGLYQLQFAAGPARNATAAEVLAATKAARIEADRQECRRRLTEHYGDALEQGSRIAGDYGEVARVNRSTGVQAAVDASNTARDTINAATATAAVEAAVVAWPGLT